MTSYEGRQLGNYRILHFLSQGGFAEVYQGEHIYLGTQVAIKILRTRLNAESMARFQAEARAIAHLEHHNIVRVLDFGIADSMPYLVMSYAAQGSLRDQHPKGTRVPLARIIAYVKQIADALKYAHEMRLIHRDIKPENLLVGPNDQILLADFGLVVLLQGSHSHTTQEMAGTLPYSAPEQLQGRPRFASDQYSLGIVVYEWITGSCPFHGSIFEIMRKHIEEPPPSLLGKNPMVPSEVEAVVLKALAKDPKRRFASIGEFATALEQASRPYLGASTAQDLNAPDSGKGESIIYWMIHGEAAEPASTEPEITQQREKADASNEQLTPTRQKTPRTPSDLDAVFLFNERLIDPDELYGRVRERETLLNRIRKGASTSIVGPRRIGKTWLMSYLQLTAPVQFGTGVCGGYLDATTAQCTTISGFATKALQELGVPHRVPTDAYQALTLLESIVQDLKTSDLLCFLCIDEFEGFSKRQEFTLDFFTSLRAMTQIGLSLVVASRRPLIDIVGNDGETSGFFNVFEQLTLEPFTSEEARGFAHSKSIEAGFTEQERDILLKYGRVDEHHWLPLRLQLVGKLLQEDKMLAQREGTHYYRPNDPVYWREFEQRLEQKYRGVMR